MPDGPALRALRAAQEEEIRSLQEEDDFAAPRRRVWGSLGFRGLGFRLFGGCFRLFLGTILYTVLSTKSQTQLTPQLHAVRVPRRCCQT